jgi:hypothetical protein
MYRSRMTSCEVDWSGGGEPGAACALCGAQCGGACPRFCDGCSAPVHNGGCVLCGLGALLPCSSCGGPCHGVRVLREGCCCVCAPRGGWTCPYCTQPSPPLGFALNPRALPWLPPSLPRVEPGAGPGKTPRWADLVMGVEPGPEVWVTGLSGWSAPPKKKPRRPRGGRGRKRGA